MTCDDSSYQGWENSQHLVSSLSHGMLTEPLRIDLEAISRVLRRQATAAIPSRSWLYSAEVGHIQGCDELTIHG